MNITNSSASPACPNQCRPPAARHPALSRSLRRMVASAGAGQQAGQALSPQGGSGGIGQQPTRSKRLCRGTKALVCVKPNSPPPAAVLRTLFNPEAVLRNLVLTA